QQHQAQLRIVQAGAQLGERHDRRPGGDDEAGNEERGAGRALLRGAWVGGQAGHRMRGTSHDNRAFRRAERLCARRSGPSARTGRVHRRRRRRAWCRHLRHHAPFGTEKGKVMHPAVGMGVACAALALALAGSDAMAADEAFPWPQGQRAAVSLAYDDAVPTHLDVAIPALDRHGLKGSFYLILAAEPVRARLPEWRAAARNGHELGNHSLFHQCSARGAGREWVQPAQDLDAASVAQMRAQVEVANTMLHAIAGSSEFTFTAPCGDRLARDGDYIGEVAGLFLGIKLVGGTVVPDMWTLDPAAV